MRPLTMNNTALRLMSPYLCQKNIRLLEENWLRFWSSIGWTVGRVKSVKISSKSMHNLFIGVEMVNSYCYCPAVITCLRCCAPFLVQPSLCPLQLLQEQRPRRIQSHLKNLHMSSKSPPVASPMKSPLPTQAWNSSRAQDRRSTAAGAAGTKCQHHSNPLLQRPVGTITSLMITNSFINAIKSCMEIKSWREVQSVANKGLYWSRFQPVTGEFFPPLSQRQSWL